jgi:hypothetical protein
LPIDEHSNLGFRGMRSLLSNKYRNVNRQGLTPNTA